MLTNEILYPDHPYGPVSLKCPGQLGSNRPEQARPHVPPATERARYEAEDQRYQSVLPLIESDLLDSLTQMEGSMPAGFTLCLRGGRYPIERLRQFAGKNCSDGTNTECST